MFVLRSLNTLEDLLEAMKYVVTVLVRNIINLPEERGIQAQAQCVQGFLRVTSQ